MTKDEIIGLSLRIASIFVVVYVFQKIGVTFSGWSHVVEVSSTAVVVMLIPLLIAGFLWKFAYRLSKILMPPVMKPAINSGWSLSDIETTAFTIIGVYILSETIPNMFYFVSVFIQSSTLKADLYKGNPLFTASSILTLAKLIIGFWLLLGAKGLHDFLNKVRIAGKRP